MYLMDNLDNSTQGKFEVTWDFTWKSLWACGEHGDGAIGARLTQTWWVSSFLFNCNSTEAGTVDTTPSFTKSFTHTLSPTNCPGRPRAIFPRQSADSSEPSCKEAHPSQYLNNHKQLEKQLLWKMAFSFPPADVSLCKPGTVQVTLVLHGEHDDRLS